MKEKKVVPLSAPLSPVELRRLRIQAGVLRKRRGCGCRGKKK